LHDASSVYAFVDVMRILGSGTDEKFAYAVKCTLDAAMLDWRITQTGTRRPWLKNLGGGKLGLETFALDLTAPPEDLQRLWRSGMELLDVIDAGLWFGPSDFPIPFADLCAGFQNVRLEGSVEDARAKVHELLHEAQTARQWSVPWGARVQVDFGPFRAMKIHEHQGEFSCIFLDEKERYYHVAIGLAAETPRIAALPFTRTMDDAVSDSDVEWNDDAFASLELVAAAIVRDFLVVEEREALFTTRPMRRRVNGRNLSTIIYLPRVRYTTPRSDALAPGDGGNARARHPVSHHLRRAGHASAGQRFLAQRYGISVPEGFTFVRPHERGVAAEAGRIRTYRSRSASRMLFHELASAPEGTRPAWFEFELDCARLLRARGMEVVHQAATRDGDGGVDLYAVDAAGVGWVVRELVGAIAAAARGSTQAVRGMIISTSRFTSGAVTEAIAQGFEIMDGDAIARAMQRV
jgi:hypothetical protein